MRSLRCRGDDAGAGTYNTDPKEMVTLTKPDQSDRGKPPADKGDSLVVVVVNGAATVVTFRGNPTLLEIAGRALEQTQNSGQPIENWELRAPDGTPLTDLSVHIKKLELADDAQLFLNLRAGIGG